MHVRTLTDDSAWTASARLLHPGQPAGHDKAPLISPDVHGLVRRALRQLLEAEGYVAAAEAGSGGEALPEWPSIRAASCSLSSPCRA